MERLPAVLPVLPIRNAVLFPSISMPLVVGRDKSVRAVTAATEKTDGFILVVAQKVLTASDPDPEDLYLIGTLGKIENIAHTEGGSRQVVVTGISRYRVAAFADSQPIKGKESSSRYLTARGEPVADVQPETGVRGEALFYNLKTLGREILELLPGATEPLVRLIDRVDEASYLCNVCAAYLNLPLSQKQELLETSDVEARMEILLKHMRKEREVLNVQREIRDKMSERLNKAQREALLREQMRTIRTELGEEGGEGEADELEDRIAKANLPADAEKQAQEELKRLRNLPASSAEHHVIRTYLETIAALPWSKKTESTIDIARARAILDEDHYGLEKVKKRIIQFLAVAKLKNDLRGPILCLVGPPGVGKTSLGQSIARALDRKFVRASLGGVRDEAEVRGHRRTYVGAMPGKILMSLKRVGVRNPLMLLDEMDKLRADFHGDPSAAMLEVLDPEQNNSFTDHYLDLPFDLSDVFFVGTANVIDTIPGPLRDRMEIIEVNGYTTREKLEIAKRYLLPRLLKEHGLSQEQLKLPDSTLQRLISHYTREAGVRELSRKIASLLRAAAEEVVERGPEATSPVQLTIDRLQNILGPELFIPEISERARKAGVATGMAWTPHGGDLLFIEATQMAGGKGSLILTGQLGDVMKESAQIALSLGRSAGLNYFGRSLDFGTIDLHIHVPAGAIPKDGPSAGVTIFTALASLLTGAGVDPTIAMTGEITLRGTVLPVGGIKEKVLAAHRAGIETVILPKKNQTDLSELPIDVRNELNIVLVESVEEVLARALPIARRPSTRNINELPAA